MQNHTKHILILYTGGTIGMVKHDDGFRPQPGFLSNYLAHHPELQVSGVPTFTIKEYELIDSSNIKPCHWVQIAQDIIANYQQYDGFLILHGTDTLAYTASALSFMLENLAKPVICTGAQLPIGQLRNDAIKNVLDSLLILQNQQICEVAIYFNNKLLRGNRSKKINADSMQAFDSPNFPCLATFGTSLQVNTNLLLPCPDGPIKLQTIKQPVIAAVAIFPGINADIIQSILSCPLDGLIISTYGAGNIPNDDPKLLQALRLANANGTVIVNVTQCLQGRVNMSQYSTGHALQATGAISGEDMTLEAALTKLYYLLSKSDDKDLIKDLMSCDLKGELTSMTSGPDRLSSGPKELTQ